MLNYIPEKKSQKVEVIEEVIPCFNVKVSVKTEKSVKSVEAVPECRQMDFEYKDGMVEFTVDRIDGHQMISINLK